MKRLALLPLIVAVCLLAGPSTASAGYHYNNNNNNNNNHNNYNNYNYNYNNSFNWGGLSNLFSNWHNDSKNYDWRDSFGQKDLSDYLKLCKTDWNQHDNNDSYFSFCKDGKEQYKVKCVDLSKYLCKDDYSWFGKLDCFKLYKKGSSKWWKFDCVVYNPCIPTPPDCDPPATVVPTPAAAAAGMGLIGLLGAGRTMRRRTAA